MKKVELIDIVIILVIVIAIFTIDVLSKNFVKRDMVFPGNKKTVIKNFFNIVYVRNSGIIFGFFGNFKKKWIINIVILVSFFLLLYIFIMMLKDINVIFVNVCFGLIIGGALSNIVDRLLHSYVTDFFDFYIRTFHWPTFNIADSAITIGLTLLIIYNIFSKVNLN